jgi:hypothetical protein
MLATLWRSSRHPATPWRAPGRRRACRRHRPRRARNRRLLQRSPPRLDPDQLSPADCEREPPSRRRCSTAQPVHRIGTTPGTGCNETGAGWRRRPWWRHALATQPRPTSDPGPTPQDPAGHPPGLTRAATSVGLSVLECCQVEPVEPFKISEHVDLDDLAAPDREAHDRERPSPRGHDDARGTIHQRRLCDPSKP